MCRLDVGRVLDRAPWQLRECPAVAVVALGLHLKATFLRHGGVPAGVVASDLSWQWEYHVSSHVVRRD